MAELSNLGYVVFKVSDLVRWEDFATNILGMMVGRKGKDFLGLRMDEHAQRILLEQGADDDLTVAGWEFDTAQELDEYVARLKSSRVDVCEGDRDLAASRCVERVYVCDDPNGFRHEFYCGAKPTSEPFRSKMLKGPGFEAGPLGVGHILPVSRDYAKSIEFYRDVLGLRVSDTIVDADTIPGVTVDAIFFHARTGRHHSLATAFMPHPKRLHHIMIQVQDMHDVGLAYDRCLNAGVPIRAGLGHHPNDNMFSFYMETPSGFGLEFGYGGVVIDEANWEIKQHSRLSDWGHRPPTPASHI